MVAWLRRPKFASAVRLALASAALALLLGVATGARGEEVAAAFALAGAAALRLGAAGVPLLVAAAAFGVSRVPAGGHDAGDVVAGTVIGLAAAVAVSWT